MSSLCHAIAAQITAFLLSSMPMHPKQNLTASNRYGAPLFLRKSHQRFSLPFLCSAIPSARYHAIAPSLFAFPSPCLSVLLSATAQQFTSSPPPRFSSPSFAFALPLFTSRRYAIASLCHALPLPRLELHRHRTANRTQPCRCQAMHRTASANQGRQCHALALSPSPHRRCK